MVLLNQSLSEKLLNTKATGYFGVSILLNIWGWLTPSTVDLGLKVIATFGAILTSVAAYRYYRSGRKKNELDMKKMLDDLANSTKK